MCIPPFTLLATWHILYTGQDHRKGDSKGTGASRAEGCRCLTLVIDYFILSCLEIAVPAQLISRMNIETIYDVKCTLKGSSTEFPIVQKKVEQKGKGRVEMIQFNSRSCGLQYISEGHGERIVLVLSYKPCTIVAVSLINGRSLMGWSLRSGEWKAYMFGVG